MSWSLSFNGRADEAYQQLEEKITIAKTGRTPSELEHIDAAVVLFKHLVPNDPKLGVYFSVTGHSPHSKDISFNTTCSVFSN
jgi:hypothetical protein